MTEFWKDIEGFEGIYQISSLGRVRSMSHYSHFKDERVRLSKGKILRLNPDKRGGYLLVYFSKNGTVTCHKVHRLVAKYFCAGYQQGLVVNHKDGNRRNNIFSNLEWVSQKENIHHSIKVLGNKPGTGLGAESKNSIPIYSVDKNGTITHFAGIREAERELGINSSGICKVLKRKRNTFHKLKFYYEDKAQ